MNEPSQVGGTPGVSIAAALSGARAALDGLARDEAVIVAVDYLGTLLAQRFRAGNKVLICGNGGSLCDAAHFAEELTGRFRADRPPLPAIALADAGHITCTANDYGFEHVFSRAVQALGKPGDVLIILSTSGNSPNCVRAVAAAKAASMTTAAFLGKGGGALANLCDSQIIVPGDTSDRIQELHMLLLHALVERIESLLFPAH